MSRGIAGDWQRCSNADSALSVTMTAFASLAAIVTVPFVVFLTLDHFGRVAATAKMPLAGSAFRMFASVALRWALNMAVRGVRPALAARWERHRRGADRPNTHRPARWVAGPTLGRSQRMVGAGSLSYATSRRNKLSPVGGPAP